MLLTIEKIWKCCSGSGRRYQDGRIYLATYYGTGRFKEVVIEYCKGLDGEFN